MPMINGRFYRRRGKDEYKDCIHYVDGLCTASDMQCNPESCQFLQNYLIRQEVEDFD